MANNYCILNLNLNSLLVIRQMPLFHQGGSDGGEILVPRTHE